MLTAVPQAANAALPVRVVVADDHMTAELHPVPSDQAAVLSLEHIEQAMREAKLPCPSRDELAQIVGGTDSVNLDGPIVVARGTPPVDDTPARLEMLLQASTDPDAVVSHYDRHHYMAAAAGQAIARVIKRVSGRDGVDVYGRPVSCRHPPDERFSLGAKVAVDADGSTVVASIAGRVKWEHGKLWVEPLLEIPGDVDFSVGNIDFAGDVHVRRNVLDLFRVKSNGNVSIDGTVEAAEVSAGGNLLVRGGIVGKEKGRCSAGGNIALKFATNATICAGGDIRAQVEISSSHVTCGGVLDIHEGSVIGGVVQARGGAKCQTLGCAAGTKTLVEAGTDPALRQSTVEQLRELRRLQKQAQDLREAAAPLLQNQKGLNAQQKEKATELLFEATEAESKAADLLRTLRAAFEAARAVSKQEVHVTKYIYPGVTIRFPEVEATIEQAIQGPVQLVPRNIKGALAVCAVSPHDGCSLPLPSRATRDELMRAVMHAMGVVGAAKN